MKLITLKNMIAAVLLAGIASACVDAPGESLAASAPQNNPLAASFDQLADEQLQANDVERSEEFRWAALAVRAGVTPSVFQITNDGKPEVYDAFVHSVTWASLTQALRPPLHRSLVAWRRTGEVLQVLQIGMFTDSAPVLNPYSMRASSAGTFPTSPVAGAKAAYFERGSVNSTWLGVSGLASIAEAPQGVPSCPVPNADAKPTGVNCQVTRYSVNFNVIFARTRSRDSRDVDALAPTRRFIAPGQTVAGVKLLFSCAVPLSTGC
jgi:hypothetical protein